MTLTLENIVVLMFVAASAVYMVARLRRVATGQNKCVCGSKSCGSTSTPSGCSVKNMAAGGDTRGGLPLLPPACNRGNGECGRGS